jgi:intein/homing endonuclease
MSEIVKIYQETNDHKIFGWIHPEDRTLEQKETDKKIRATWPEFKLYGNGYWEAGERSKIAECVLKLRGKHLPALYQQVGSCFPAESPVYMADGTYKNIEYIKVGDEVITHNNKTKKVTELFTRPYTGRLYSLNVSGFDNDFRMTEDHLVYTFENISPRKNSNRYTPGKGKWVAVKDLQPNDRVFIPYGNEFNEYQEINLQDYLREEDYEIVNDRILIKNTKKDNSLPLKIKVDENFARLIGLYLAEGGTRTNNKNGKICGLDFSFCHDEEIYVEEVINLIDKIFGIKAVRNKVPSKKTVVGVRCNASSLGRFFANFIDATLYTKYVPNEFFKSPKTVKISLLRGWLD